MEELTPLQRFAEIISIVSSPFLVVPIFSLWVISFYAPNITQFVRWSGPFIIFAVLFPMAFIYYGVKSGRLTDMHVMLREQRIEPFIVTMFGALLLIIAYHFLAVPKPLYALSIVLFINGLVFFLITLVWKISIHSAAYAGAVLILAHLVNPNLAYLLLVLPLIMWARVYRHRHSVLQVLGAAVVVSLITLAAFRLI